VRTTEPLCEIHFFVGLTKKPVSKPAAKPAKKAKAPVKFVPKNEDPQDGREQCCKLFASSLEDSWVNFGALQHTATDGSCLTDLKSTKMLVTR